MNKLSTTKSLLAKLLASENLTVEHGKFSTASFDVKNRVLRLPIWKEMSGSLYDLMVLHEVGHALWTPEAGWHESASKKGPGFKSFLNVVEDARIERKIKDKYPGGRKSFTDGYLELVRKDFFGTKGVDLNELNLIDRINLYFKAGSSNGIEFSEEENGFIEKVATTRSWDDVVRVSEELYEYAKDHDSDTDMSDHEYSSFEFGDDEDSEDEEMESDGDASGENSEVDETLEKFKEHLKDLLEAGEEEKEDSGSSTGTGEGEGESEEKSGSETGKSEKAKEGEEADKGENGKEENSSDGDKKISSGSEGGTITDKDLSKGVEDYKPSSITDNNFRNKEELLVDDSDGSYEYVNLPKSNLEKIIIDYKDVHSEIREHYVDADSHYEASNQILEAGKSFIEFRNKNKKTVEYLAKEFEMKKAADAHSRSLTANSGIVDSSLLHTYKYNEHIFKKISVTPDGKNHGLIMVVDWSGSMHRNIKGTVEQMMTLVMFCKRVNIPFEVFLFTDRYYSESRDTGETYSRWTHKEIRYGDMVINGFHLLNVFSSRMRAAELHSAYINMTAIAGSYERKWNYYGGGYHSIPDKYDLGGTPLNNSLFAMNDFIPYFKTKNNVQIVNMVYLTDGESGGSNVYWSPGRTEKDDGRSRETSHFGRYYSSGGKRPKTFIRDLETKKEYLCDESRGRMTALLVEILRDKHNINIVNFFLVDRLRKWDFSRWSNDVESSIKVFRKEKSVVYRDVEGWSSLYIMKGGRDLQTEEKILEIGEDATRGQIRKAFSKFSKGRLENKKLLSQFVDMVAA